MLIVITKNQVLTCDRVCQGCLLANQQGYPRWQGEQLGCAAMRLDPHQGRIYECQMGFRLVNVELEQCPPTKNL